LKTLLKSVLHAVFLCLAFPCALTSGFGRVEAVYLFWAHFCAAIPGLPGDYFRIAYYRLTLTECALESRIEFGSFFAHPQARVGRGVYIGNYCVLGRTSIGDRTQIAAGVQILSGRRQHARDAEGRILGAEQGVFEAVAIGADCWIGAAAIVMAEVGSGTTIGAGSVVTKPIPPGSVAVGSPARVIRTAGEA
jgi:acetyltransferase-like isoleucine patch superfamily enzyme